MKKMNIQTFKEKIMLERKKVVLLFFIFLALVGGAIGIYIFNLIKKDKAKQYEYEAYRNYYKQDFKRAAELFLRAYDNEKNIVYLLNAGYAFSFAGEDKKAIEVLEKVENSDDEVFSNLAKFKLAMILKKTNKEEAANKLKQIVNGKRDFIKDAALYELAKIYEESNREQAKIYHEEIIKRFPSSPFAEIVKDKIKQ